MLLVFVVFTAWFPKSQGQGMYGYGYGGYGGAGAAGQWGPWGAWSLCNTSPAACGPGTYVRNRECRGMVCNPEIRGGWPIATFEEGNCEKPCKGDNAGRGAYYNGNWGEWSKWACTEPCKPGLMAVRERYCDDPAPSPGHHCIGDEEGSDRAVEDAACEDYCEKEWTEWSSWSVCTMTCDAPVRKRIRECLGIGSECPGKAEEVKNCDQQWRHESCPVQHGKWGRWGPWSPDCWPQCSDGVHTRHRDCDNPPPAGEGEYCVGEDEDTKRCTVPEYMMIQCGATAQWGSWSKWKQCTATCGRATGFRTRECRNEDGTRGNTCRGKDKEEAACSLPPCSILEFQAEEDLKRQAAAKLREERKNKIEHNLLVDLDASVKLPCRQNKAQKAADSAEWKKDGEPIEVEGKHLVLDKWDLTITSSTVEDTGIYVCRRDGEETKPIIYAVTVVSDKAEQAVKAETQTKLPCKAGVLAIILKGASAEWKKDSKVIKKMADLKSPSLGLTKPNTEDSGVYTCDVMDPGTKRQYTTNRVQLKVTQATMMDQALGKALDIKTKNPAVFYGAIGGVGGFVLLVVVVCLVMRRIQANELKMDEPLSSDEEEKIGMHGSQSAESEDEEGLVEEGAVIEEDASQAAPEDEKGSDIEVEEESDSEEEKGSENEETESDGDEEQGSDSDGSESQAEQKSESDEGESLEDTDDSSKKQKGRKKDAETSDDDE